MNKNDKASIREVRDLIDKLDDEKITPMQKNIAVLVEKLSNFINIANNRHDYYLKKFDINKTEHSSFITIRLIRNIGIILGILVTATAVWNTIVTFCF